MVTASGADLSDYFNYGFNEETWKAYCEKQRRLQLGLEPSAPVSTENKITVQQGRTGNAEKEPENNIVKMDFKTDFVALVGGRMKAGPPPNRKLGGTIDVIGGQAGTIRRVEGRRRDKHASEENPIQADSGVGGWDLFINGLAKGDDLFKSEFCRTRSSPWLTGRHRTAQSIQEAVQEQS
ncbi:UNVERIFIED_CONTAM: hypothetical protein K2H54_049607 [Gekko kuhli]